MKPLLICLFVIVISACATKHQDTSLLPKVNQQDLQSLSQWSIRGKLAIITPDERKSAYISWQQKDEKINMLLTTVVGSTIASLSYDGSLATLSADDQVWQDSSPSHLILSVTGWEVPVESLSQWMKAEVEGQLIESRYENGLVKQMRAQCLACPIWQIDYKSYAAFNLNERVYHLPTAMNLVQDTSNTRLILRIDEWQALTETNKANK